MTQLREHRDDALEKLDPLGIARCGDQLANLQDIERGYTFHGFATSDLVVLGDIAGDHLPAASAILRTTDSAERTS